MAYYAYASPPALAQVVHSFWVDDGEDGEEGDDGEDRELGEDRQAVLCRKRALPDGKVQVVFNLRLGEHLRVYHSSALRQGQRFPDAFVRGAHSESFHFEASVATVQVGVIFKPGGAYPFFACPVGELRNQLVALDALWGANATMVRERLLEASNRATQIGVLARALPALAVRPLEPHPVVAYALRALSSAPHPHSIEQVAHDVGLSRSRFSLLFRDACGLTPKQFYRVQRFQTVLRRARAGSYDSWADLAIIAGYYDQAHLVNEFSALAGMSPTSYLRQSAAHPPASIARAKLPCMKLYD
jgi:methylphosphotriester-DNA--protein-cysteine methyltransferase